jgi:hypothetical protein
MSSPALVTADFEVLVESAPRRRDHLSVAGQPAHLLPFLYQAFVYRGFVGQRSYEFAVFCASKFLKRDGAKHGGTPGRSVEEGRQIQNSPSTQMFRDTDVS